MERISIAILLLLNVLICVDAYGLHYNANAAKIVSV